MLDLQTRMMSWPSVRAVPLISVVSQVFRWDQSPTGSIMMDNVWNNLKIVYLLFRSYRSAPSSMPHCNRNSRYNFIFFHSSNDTIELSRRRSDSWLKTHHVWQWVKKARQYLGIARIQEAEPELRRILYSWIYKRLLVSVPLEPRCACV